MQKLLFQNAYGQRKVGIKLEQDKFPSGIKSMERSYDDKIFITLSETVDRFLLGCAADSLGLYTKETVFRGRGFFPREYRFLGVYTQKPIDDNKLGDEALVCAYMGREIGFFVSDDEKHHDVNMKLLNVYFKFVERKNSNK